MKNSIWCTEFKEEGKAFEGGYVKAESWEKAQEWCRKNAPHLEVTGEFVCEIHQDGTEITNPSTLN